MRLDTNAKRLENRQSLLNLYKCDVKEFPEVNATIGFYKSGEKLAAMAFSGTAGKPAWHYTFRNEAQQNEYIQKWLDGLKNRQDYKEKRKAEKTGLSEPAHSAKVLKGHLQKFFPGVKFSVTSDTFSMGCSIDVSYTDGPLLQEVEAIANLFQYGRFDAMQDLSYSVNVEVPGCQGAKYVSVSREMSEELKASILPILRERFCPTKDGDYYGGEFYSYAPYQQLEAEKILLGLTDEEIKTRTQERINIVLGRENNPPQNALQTSKKPSCIQTQAESIENQNRANFDGQTSVPEQSFGDNNNNVVNFAEYKAKKAQKQQEEAQKEAFEFGEYVTNMVNTLTNSQIEALIKDVYKKADFSKEEKLTTIRHFLAILAERDRPAALRIFDELDLQSLAK